MGVLIRTRLHVHTYAVQLVKYEAFTTLYQFLLQLFFSLLL